MSIQDIAFTQDNHGNFDIITTDDNTLETVEGMETAFYFQLFTDVRVSKNDVSRPLDRGGWLGDLVTKKDGYQVGSMMFLKQQSRYTVNDVSELEAFANEALKYFVTIKAAQKISADIDGNTIEGSIKVAADETSRYSALWEDTITTGPED